MWKHRRKLRVGALVLVAIPLLSSLNRFATKSVWADDDGGPRLTVNPTSLTFTAQEGGGAPPAQSVSVGSTGSALNFTASTSASWLMVKPSSGTTPATLSVSVNPAGLALGTHNAAVRVSVPHTEESSRYVSVTFSITSASNTLTVTPDTLAFSYQLGGSLPSSQSLSVQSGSASGVGFTITTNGGPWLAASPASGMTPATVTVSVNPSGLTAGTYTGSVLVSSSIGSVAVQVTLTITTAATITVTPSSLAFGFQQGGTVPASQSLSVSSTTAVNFTATANTSSGGSWLTVNPTAGSTPATLTVSVNPGTLAVGTYSGSIVVSSSLGSVTAPVTLTITSSSGGGGGAHVLLAWSELGMHCMDGQDYSVLAVLPPYNTIYAKLLTTGTTPVEVTSGVTLTYVAFKDASGSINTTSVGSALSPYSTTPNTPQKTNFWNYARALLLLSPNPDVGVRNYPVQSLTPQSMTYGNMLLDSSVNVWKAEGIPTMPYDDNLAVNSYPMALITAKDSSGNVLASATVVLNVSDQMSCANCHAPNTNSAAMPSGGWINFPQLTANQNMRLNILKKHDDLSPIPASVLAAVQAKGYTTYQSSLYQTAYNGGAVNNPVFCAACHTSNALNEVGYNSGVAGVNPLTADVHTRHAGVTVPGSTTTLDNMTDPNNPGCYQCHPGPTVKCQRGAMTGVIPGSTAVTCYGCHGNLSRVGTSTRSGWLDEPNCQMCHQTGTTYTTAFTTTDIGPSGTQRTSSDATFATNANAPSSGFSLYRFSTGHGGVNCSGCHGQQHAEYPTSQPNDQVYSVNLQGYAGRITECSVCHGSSFATSPNGGPHGMHTVGSAWVGAHPDYVSTNGTASCAYCHGADFRGTSLSMILTTKTLAGHTFPAYHQMNCYDCHNGPGGG